MNSVIEKKFTVGISYLSLISLLILVFFLSFQTTLMSADNVDLDLLIDEDNWQAEVDIDLISSTDYPIYINSATINDLRRIPGLTEEEVTKILQFRRSREITNISSLRNVGFSDDKIFSILPYISFRVIEPISFYHSQRHFLRSADSEIVSRFYQKTELQRKRTKLGFVSLNDYGSKDLTRYHSYYFSQQSETVFEQIVLGKYRLSLGQGVAFAPKSGFSKSSAATTYPVKNYSPLRPHSNPYKNWSLEGFAAIINTGAFDLIPFYSQTKIDASLIDDQISTIYPYGTTNKDRRNSAKERIGGVALRYRHKNSSYGLYYSHNRFDKEFVNTAFSKRYDCLGTFFYHREGDFDLFGEFAYLGDKKGIVSGIRWGRGLFQQLLLYRYYEKDFPYWHGSPFSSQANFANEEGLYYGLRIRPSRRWTINVFFDVWRHPDTRYFEKMPTTRTEQYIQFIHKRQRDVVRLKLHHKTCDKYRVLDNLPKIREEKKTVLAIDWTHELSNSLSKKSGIEYISRYIPEVKDFKKGILLFENINWRYRQLRILYQINVFRSDISHYIYEYSLDGMWESRPLVGDDIYTYLIIRTNITEDIRLQGKLAYFFSGKGKSLITQFIYRL
ncbi:MAG: hypothetical protein K0B81_01235 [Candidatus Cloacimonetes bacterium]|nr:hypothetical protein [Candidatus Cloacimonadota bacterium]